MNIEPIFEAIHGFEDQFIKLPKFKQTFFSDFVKLADHYNEKAKAITISFDDLMEIDCPSVKMTLLNRLIGRRIYNNGDDYHFTFTEAEKLLLPVIEDKLVDASRDTWDSATVGTYLLTLSEGGIRNFKDTWPADNMMMVSLDFDTIDYLFPRDMVASDEFQNKIDLIHKLFKVSGPTMYTKLEMEESKKIKDYILEGKKIKLPEIQCTSLKRLLILADRGTLDDDQYKRAIEVLTYLADKMGNWWTAQNAIGFSTRTIKGRDRFEAFTAVEKEFGPQYGLDGYKFTVETKKPMTIKQMVESFQNEVGKTGLITFYGTSQITDFFGWEIPSLEEYFTIEEIEKGLTDFAKKHGAVLFHNVQRHYGDNVDHKEVEVLLRKLAEDYLVISTRMWFGRKEFMEVPRIDCKLRQFHVEFIKR